MSDKFVVSTNEIGRIIVTDVETGNVYRYDNLSHFLGLIRLLNEQQSIIRRDEMSIQTMMSNMKKLEKENEQLKEQVKKLKIENEALQDSNDALAEDMFHRLEEVI